MKALAIARTLRQIESEILAALDRGKKALLSAGDEARIIGLQLDEARAKHFPRGEGPQWLAWAKSKFGFEKSHVYNYIEVAERWSEFSKRLENSVLEYPFLALADLKADERAIALKARAQALNAKPLSLPDGVFDVLVLDPPWPYGTAWHPDTRRVGSPYPEMSLEQIAALPVVARAEEDCTLWLWTTNAFLHEAFHLIESWEFGYHTMLTWAKDKIGVGEWLRGQTEHCLLCSRGKPVITHTAQSTLLTADAREHSRKPDEFYALVESLCPGTKLEFFAREPREGWQSFGDETTKFSSR